MLSIAEALDLVLRNTGNKVPARIALAESLGLALAEQIVSDIDSPPHDKSIVDGYAVRAEDVASGSAELTVLEEVTAGAAPTLPVSTGHCTRIMTGAPVPKGADAVVMIEHSTTVADGTRVRINGAVRAGQNIMVCGASIRKGDVVLPAGHEIRPAEIGLLAEVGRSEVAVIPPARVAILSTGNELVAASQTPAASQIRNSNGPMLAAAARRAGAIPIELGIARDDHVELREKIETGLTADVLVLSGGVSAGVLDLVPAVLRELGVEQVFHKVRLKPGKPLWFGVHRPCLVFGVPGNPVSSLVCFELFVRPAIARLSGQNAATELRQLPARLAAAFEHRGERPTYFPAVVRRDGDGFLAETVRWRGSADLRGLAQANALAMFPAGDRAWQAGDPVEVLLF
jgi:molybdopterin molybdotransferase